MNCQAVANDSKDAQLDCQLNHGHAECTPEDSEHGIHPGRKERAIADVVNDDICVWEKSESAECDGPCEHPKIPRQPRFGVKICMNANRPAFIQNSSHFCSRHVY